MIPTCEGPFAILPPGRHRATITDIYQRFVEEAPFRERRELIFRALTLLIDIVAAEYPKARFWIDGGFTTQKDWEAPEDADVVVLLPVKDASAVAADETAMGWVTLHNVSAVDRSTKKLHPFGGLLDVFPTAATEGQLEYWDDLWSWVRGPDRKRVPGASKGYLEVLARDIVAK